MQQRLAAHGVQPRLGQPREFDVRARFVQPAESQVAHVATRLPRRRRAHPAGSDPHGARMPAIALEKASAG